MPDLALSVIVKVDTTKTVKSCWKKNELIFAKEKMKMVTIMSTLKC